MRSQRSPADEAAGEGAEAFVDVVAAVGADQEAAAVVEPGEGALDDPAVTAEPGALLALAASDHRFDAALPDEPAVLVVVVIAAVAEQPLGSTPGAADATADGRHQVEQRQQLRDVVAVAAGERPRQRQAAAVYEEMVLAPTPPPAASRATAATRSSRSRSRAPAAAAPSRSRCAARTRSPAARADHPAASGPGSETGAASSATAAPPAATTDPKRSRAAPASTPPPELDDRCRRTSIPPSGSFTQLEVLRGGESAGTDAGAVDDRRPAARRSSSIRAPRRRQKIKALHSRPRS